MLYIMRHGVTDWNQLHKLQGRTDIPLNKAGRDMARNAREKYWNLHLDVCFASPLLRAHETARLVLEGRDTTIYTDDRLVEMSFGEYEGIADSFQMPDCPVNVIFQQPELYTSSVGGAETFDELYARISSFIDEVVAPRLEHGEDILIVGHGCLNCGIITYLQHLPLEKFWDSGLEQCIIQRIL